MHAVKAEERGDCRCGKGIPEQPLGKQIHDTGNQDAKQSTHKTPAKGSHAQKPDTQGNQDLTKMRMSCFVGC